MANKKHKKTKGQIKGPFSINENRSIEPTSPSTVVEQAPQSVELILKSAGTLKVVAEVKAIIQVRPAGENIQLVLNKIPEVLNRSQAINEDIELQSHSLDETTAAVDGLKLELDELALKQEDMTREMDNLQSGKFDIRDMKNLPVGIRPESLKQPQILELYLSSKNLKLKQIESDLQLQRRKLDYQLKRQSSLEAKLAELDDDRLELLSAAKKIVEVLQQTREILKNDVSELPEIEFQVPKAKPRISAEVSKEKKVKPHSTASQPSRSEQNSEVKSENLKKTSTKFLNLSRQDNHELENLLASREYDLWKIKFDSLEAKYKEVPVQAESSAVNSDSSDESEQEFRIENSEGQEFSIKPDDSLFQVSREEIKQYSFLADLDESPSKLDVAFEDWMKKEMKETKPLISRFDPIITED